MAISYYDYDFVGWGDSTANDAQFVVLTCNCTCNATTTTVHYNAPIYVQLPAKWSREDALAFVKLINKETKTGWLVQSLIFGEVVICDPRVQTRSMKDFLPLLLWNANGEDAARIREFFEEHGED